MWQEKLRVVKTNKIAALYPSVKFLIVCLYSTCSMLLNTIRFDGYPLAVIGWFLLVPALCAASGVWKRFRKAFLKVLVVAAVIFAVQSFIIPDTVVLWQFWFLKLYKGGLVSGITLSFAVMNIAGIFLWMFQTTENKEISSALDNSGMSYKATYVFLSTLQMIEVLQKDSHTIMNAQRARGVETEGNLLVRMRAFFPSLVPLILGSITSAEERVLTLESKGFDVPCRKTRLYHVERSPYDRHAVVTAWTVTVAVIVWRVLLWVL